jgi:hypothetical protein
MQRIRGWLTRNLRAAANTKLETACAFERLLN